VSEPLAGRPRGLRITGLASLLAIGAAVSVLVSGPGKALTVWALPQYASTLRSTWTASAPSFCSSSRWCPPCPPSIPSSTWSTTPTTRCTVLPYFLLFVAGMYGIVVVTDLMAGFFLLWQLMTLSSYALVRFEYRQRENGGRASLPHRDGGRLRFHPARAGVLARGPVVLPDETLMRYDFDAISPVCRSCSGRGAGRGAGLLCFLIGFGIKRACGLRPAVAARRAPAAPSPVSALLSGVMIKTGIYGLMRSFLWLVPVEALDAYPSEVWGLVLAGFGTATLFIGTTQALGQDQSKRLLPSAASARSLHPPAPGRLPCAPQGRVHGRGILPLATIGFSASLYHTLNHASSRASSS